MSSFASNPTSTLTRPADTNAYTANDLVASSVTAGSVVVPSFALNVWNLASGAGGGFITRMRLMSNHTTGLAGIQVAVQLWSVAPTFTTGDNGAYAVATGAAGYLGRFTGTFQQFADGAVCELAPVVGPHLSVKLASTNLVYWDLQAVTGFTPQSGKTFTLTPEIVQS